MRDLDGSNTPRPRALSTVCKRSFISAHCLRSETSLEAWATILSGRGRPLRCSLTYISVTTCSAIAACPTVLGTKVAPMGSAQHEAMCMRARAPTCISSCTKCPAGSWARQRQVICRWSSYVCSTRLDIRSAISCGQLWLVVLCDALGSRSRICATVLVCFG